MAQEVKIGHEGAFFALADEGEGSSMPTRSSRGELWGFDAALVVPGLVARTRVHLADPALEASLPEFFAELAAEWNGWTGERRWASYEGGLSLLCAHDGLGHVTVAVRLAEANSRAWTADGIVPVDAGQLDQVARDLSVFFGGHS
jgi:hypothetical protein